MPFPSVKIGPGRSSRSHTADEYVMLKEMEKAIDLYLLDNCTISGSTIEGFDRPIVANSCDEQFISVTDVVTE